MSRLSTISRIGLALFHISTTVVAQPTTPAAKPATVDSSQHIASRIVNSSKPVLVDFWAPWCAPCKMLEPIYKELEKEFGSKVLFLKVNTDIHKILAGHFRVSSIPTVFLVKDKVVVASLPGVRSKEEYQTALRSLLVTPTKDSTAQVVKKQSPDTSSTTR